MRRKLVLGGLAVFACIGIGYVVGAALVVFGLIVFGVGYLIGKRRGAH